MSVFESVCTHTISLITISIFRDAFCFSPLAKRSGGLFAHTQTVPEQTGGNTKHPVGGVRAKGLKINIPLLLSIRYSAQRWVLFRFLCTWAYFPLRMPAQQTAGGALSWEE